MFNFGKPNSRIRQKKWTECLKIVFNRFSYICLMGLFDKFTSKKMAKNLTEYLFENIREAGNKIDSARYYLKEISKHKGGSYEVPMKLRHYEETLNDINNAIMKLKSNIQNDKDLT